MSRIAKTPIDIDHEKVRRFFDERAQKYNADTPYSSVLYQDHNPQIAAERDRYEKEAIGPLLGVESSSSVLDVGCGIGRWAEAFEESGCTYTGIDISEKLIEVARSRDQASRHAYFVGSASDIDRFDIAARAPFDIVIMSGIMIYLNDDALRVFLLRLPSLVRQKGRIYMREPIALVERLTLSEFWSDELSQPYSAIYRSRDELEAFFSETLYPQGIGPINFEPLYRDDRLNNRRETAQHFAIAQRLA